MALKRMLPFFVIVLTLTGCFRQASDTFDTVDSQGSNTGVTPVIAPTETETSAITIIAPETDVTVEASDTDLPIETRPTLAVQPTDDVPPPATNLPQPTSEPLTDTVPTATEQTFITPEPPGLQQTMPPATPSATPIVDPSISGLQATPTDMAATAGDCEYEVQGGDNTFRIALNHNVTLDDLLAINNIDPNFPIIQPGQILLIPGCVVGESTAEVIGEPSVPTLEVDTGVVLHTVAQGETLLAIARQYGVTVNAILSANPNITDPNRITPGQELRIPPTEE